MELIICTEQVNIMGGIDMTDNVNKPSHYQGSKGLESIEVIDNFIGSLPGKAAWCWGMLSSIYSDFRRRTVLKI